MIALSTKATAEVSVMKRITAVLVAVIATAILAGCGKKTATLSTDPNAAGAIVLEGKKGYSVEYNKVEGELKFLIRGPAKEIAVIVIDPTGKTHNKILSKEDMVDNVEEVVIPRTVINSGEGFLVLKTLDPEKEVLRQKIVFAPMNISGFRPKFSARSEKGEYKLYSIIIWPEDRYTSIGNARVKLFICGCVFSGKLKWDGWTKGYQLMSENFSIVEPQSDIASVMKANGARCSREDLAFPFLLSEGEYPVKICLSSSDNFKNCLEINEVLRVSSEAKAKTVAMR